MDLWRRYEDQLPGGAGEGQRILPHPYAGSEGECIRFYLYGLQKPGAIILDQPGTVRPSYEKWEFQDGTSAGNVRIENIQGNNFSFTVTVECIETNNEPGAAEHVGETLLTTGLITPGSYIEYKKLDKPLPKGNYVCIATFSGYNDKQEFQGNVGMQIVIRVLN